MSSGARAVRCCDLRSNQASKQGRFSVCEKEGKEKRRERVPPRIPPHFFSTPPSSNFLSYLFLSLLSGFRLGHLPGPARRALPLPGLPLRRQRVVALGKARQERLRF